MTTGRVRFSVIGLNHGHIYSQVNLLLSAGGELVSFYATEPNLITLFREKYPQAKLARRMDEILEDKSVQLIASASIPNERAAIGISAMKHGKDFFVDKPGVTTKEQLDKVRHAQKESGRIFSIFYAERFDNRAVTKAGEIVHYGAIGRVFQTTGFGPHTLDAANRPDWFFKREKYGGILTDIGTHQIDQFVFFTKSTRATIMTSQIANYNHPQWPEFQDFGDLTIISDTATGYARVDWFTPSGLGAWGDDRLFVLGTDGYIEVRKNCDIAGKSGRNHLFLVDKKGIQYIDCSNVELSFGKKLINDVLNRTETAMTQEHCFLVTELAIDAQMKANKLGYLKEMK